MSTVSSSDVANPPVASHSAGGAGSSAAVGEARPHGRPAWARVSDLRIGVKLLTLAGLGVLLTVVVGMIGQSAVRQVQRQGEEIANVTAARQVTGLIIHTDWARHRRFILNEAVSSGAAGEAAAKGVEDTMAAVLAGVATLEKGASSEESGILTQLRAAVDASEKVYEADIAPMATRDDLTGDDYRTMGVAIDTKFSPQADKVNTAVDELSEYYRGRMRTQIAASEEVSGSAVTKIWLFTGVGGVLLFGAGYLISRLVAGPIIQVRDALVALARGDLTRQVPIDSRDEVGEMAQALNQAEASLRSAMREINGTSTTLSGAAEELSAVSSQVASNSEETSAQADVLAGTASEVSASVQTVASATEEMSASIREIAQSSTEAVRIAGVAMTEAVTANETVAKLGASSAEIGTVVKVITSIAEQTNLLALNATIEAARAGAAGTGFAVVAEEVKQLAQETARATGEISNRVEAIQSDTDAAVEAIARISRTIEDVNSYQTTIASAVEEQSATTSEISRSIVEAAGGATSIATDIAAVTAAAQSSSQGIGQAQRSTAELAGLSGDLQRLVGQFIV